MHLVRLPRIPTPAVLRAVAALVLLAGSVAVCSGCQKVAQYYHSTANDIVGAAGGAATVDDRRMQRIHEDNEMINAAGHPMASSNSGN